MLESIKSEIFKGKNLLIIAALGIVFILAVLFTLIFGLRSARRVMNPSTATTPHSYTPSLEESISGFGLEMTTEQLRLADFMLDESIDPIYDSHYYYYREQRSSWTEEEISKFWIPIREITVDIVAHENDKKIEAIFK